MTEVIQFFYSWQDSKKKIIVVLSPSRLKISDYFLYSIVLFLILLFPILYSISDKKLLLKFSKKQSQKTKQVEYYELFETRSFSGKRLIYEEIIQPKWRNLPVACREAAGM